MSAVRVLIVDDHEVVRLGLRFALDDEPDIRVVGEASGADEAIERCAQWQPNVVILDIRMPGRSGIEVCREITERWPAIRVLMLSSFHDDDLIREAVQAGATGYILKGGSTTELIRALRAVAQGAASLDPAVAVRVLTIMRQDAQRGNPFAGLTRREMEILALLSRGKTNGEIADALTMSEKTVRNHVSAILAKLDVENRFAAAMFATQNRIQDYIHAGG